MTNKSNYAQTLAKAGSTKDRERTMYGGFPRNMASLLLCPQDGGTLELREVEEGEKGRLRNAKLCCWSCGVEHRIVDGIAIMTETAPEDEEARREQRLRDEGAEEEYALSLSSPTINALELEPMLQALAPDGAHVLELGCGSGRYTTILAERSRSVLAVDFSIGSLNLLKRRLAADAPVALVHADVTRFNISPGAFDSCLSTLVSNLPTQAHREAMFALSAAAIGDAGHFVFGTHFHGIRERLRGVPQSGHYSTEGIYRYAFTRREIMQEASRHFAKVRVRPLVITVPLLSHMGALEIPLSRLAEWIPALNGFGRLLLCTASQPRLKMITEEVACHAPSASPVHSQLK